MFIDVVWGEGWDFVFDLWYGDMRVEVEFENICLWFRGLWGKVDGEFVCVLFLVGNSCVRIGWIIKKFDGC